VGDASCLTINVIPAKAGIQTRFRKWAAGICVALAALAIHSPVLAQLKPSTADVETHEIRVDAKPIAGFNRNGEPFVSDRLAWRGGLVLTSPSGSFGGWSGLALDADGARFVAVSDSGVWMTGELVHDGARPKAIRDARLGPLLNKKGGALGRQRERDAEAIALASGTPEKGTALIAFEQADRIGVFTIGKDGLGKPDRYLDMPPEAARMRMDGIEALTVLAGGPRKGAVVAFAENILKGDKMHRGWIWTAAGIKSFTVPGLGDYSITDAASLDDGSVLLLERRFRWFEGLRIRLRHLPADAIRPGAAVRGEILLKADTAQEIDNLEALALSRGPDGETVLTLMSDDNFNHFLQRTVLLQFTLKDGPATEASAANGGTAGVKNAAPR
jgi:hypothetical protein